VSGGGGARRAGAVSRARVNIPWSGLVGMSGTKVDVSERLRICHGKGVLIRRTGGVFEARSSFVSLVVISIPLFHPLAYG
jgi:hypothetical protein